MISNDSSRNLLSIQMIDNFTSSLVYIWYILKMCDKLNNFQNYYYYYFFLYSQFQSFDASLSLSLSLSLFFHVRISFFSKREIVVPPFCSTMDATRLKYLNIKRVSNNWNRFLPSSWRWASDAKRGLSLGQTKAKGNKNYCTKRKMETRTSADARTHAR